MSLKPLFLKRRLKDLWTLKACGLFCCENDLCGCPWQKGGLEGQYRHPEGVPQTSVFGGQSCSFCYCPMSSQKGPGRNAARSSAVAAFGIWGPVVLACPGLSLSSQHLQPSDLQTLNITIARPSNILAKNHWLVFAVEECRSLLQVFNQPDLLLFFGWEGKISIF